MIKHKTCESCGMPMGKPEDFGGKNPKNSYCVYCSNPAGDLKSYEEVLNGMVAFIIKTQGLNNDDSLKKAKEHMARMPAWRQQR